MARFLIHRKDWRDMYDFLSEPYSYCLITNTAQQTLVLVVKLTDDEVFYKMILHDIHQWKFYFENSPVRFDHVDGMLEHGHKHGLICGGGGESVMFKLGRPVYNRVMTLQYLAGRALKKIENRIDLTFPNVPLYVVDRMRRQTPYF